jgi:rhamnose transport system substrate-binding protein
VIPERFRRFAATGATLMFVLAACGEAADSPGATSPPDDETAEPTSAATEPTGDGDLNVVFIPKAVNNPYFDAAAEGAQRAADELGGQFTQIGPQNATPDEQIPYIQDATTQGYSAIVVSATGADEVAPALQAAMDAGIPVVGYDSSPASGAYDVFVNQTDFSLIGGALAEWACNLAPDCSGEIAILSATATATNQNAWIADMETALEEEQYADLELVDIVYGNDDPQESTTQAQGLLQSYPDLEVIVAPTTVGILAAAQVVSQEGSDVKVTGLGLPNDMREFVESGVTPEFGLWSVPDLGYLAYHVAAKLVSGEITGEPGETFTVEGLNDGEPYEIGEDSVVILGPPFTFDESNIDDFNF